MYTGDGTATVCNGLTRSVTKSGAGTGTLNLVGSNNQTVNGNVGVGNALKQLNLEVRGSPRSGAGTVNSQKFTKTETGHPTILDDVNASNLNVTDGTLNI
ncbi:hypothetical protein [Aliarcobacter skirrowii]|uniref:Uncharacterized protein n=1 Tax=Aliarcobacter skirrowii CCUG 10374 TaxID=1032239 RepID=A0ABY0EHT0_9BACT|nr:hypothetical protein [Aliarcobacter skirrowii]RXI24637.1 hypothetical protein CP959_10200 [Aliarcobacter skirrowii CCUG 10374]